MAASNWLTLTASVASVPFATFTILVLATLMPPLVTLGPPVMVTPLLLMVVSPVVTEVKFGLSTTLTFICLVAASYEAVVLVPSTRFTVSPGLMLSAAPPLACRFQPFSAVAFTSLSCDTFTASVPSTPAVTPVILPEPPSLIVTLPNFGASAIWRLIAPVAGSVTVFRFAPE
ncbi:hypothetical protein D9M68_599610 [compost metagenome]